jgi:transcriptional regulator with PAS, ATPase and Fis domain
MRKLIDRLERVADTETSILITGETGTGKELVAQALHRRSRRHKGPFVAVNCAALPDALLESELFGHKSGAFTDAKTERKGLFFQANSGTLFFDEIGDFPLVLQPKLLRSLEERRVRPIGGTSEIAFDVRIIAATNRDIETAVEESRFREDLYYRINVIQIDLPPLRERGTDILLLAQHFVEQFAIRSDKQIAGISNEASEKLLNYTWPGNVRELRNIIERAVALTGCEKISVDDLPKKIRDYRVSHFLVGSDNPSELVPIQEVERRYILHVIKTVRGNKTLAARVLGLDRKTLYRKLQHYKVDR